MSDLKISQLATESPLAGTELVEVVTGGINKKTTTQDIADLGGGGGTWGSITGTLSAQTDLNTALGLKAPLASPALTGTPTAPTAAANTNTTQLATTAFVQQSKFVYYVNDYGLVADSDGTTGNGTDNATALGTLVDLVLANGGGTIRLGQGIYRYTGTIAKTGDNVTVEGDGMGISTLFCDNTSVNLPAWDIEGDNNHYRNFTLQSRKTFQSGGVGIAVRGSNSSAFRVEVKEANCFGIFIGGVGISTTDIAISECVVHDCSADGIHASIGVSRCIIVNNTIHDCADDAIGIGFEGSANNIVVTGNTIYKVSAGVAVMGYSSSGVVPDVYNITVANNSIEQTWLSGVVLHITEGSLENVNITGNTIRDTGGYSPVGTVLMRGVGQSYGIGLMCASTPATRTMRNISVTNNNIFTARNSFISIGYPQGVLLTGLLRDIKVSGNICQGISAVGGAGSWGFGTSASSQSPADALYPGIAVHNIVSDIEISDNQIRGANMNAIRCASTVLGGVSIKNNQAFDCNVATGIAHAYSVVTTTSSTSISMTGNTYLGTAFATGIASIGTGTDVLDFDSPQEPINAQSGTSYTVVTNDIGKTITLSNSSARAITMPAASAWPAGKPFYIKDLAGSAGSANITMTRAGSDTFEGGGTTNVISTDYETRGYYHLSGDTVWYITSVGGAAPPAPVDFTDLGDVPASYTGEAAKIVTVKGDETGLEFVTAPAGLNLSGYVVVTGTDTLDSSDFNKTILCSGTSSDYTIDLPTAVGNEGNWYEFVGVAALTKVVTVNGNSTETINGLTTNRPFTGRGGFKIVSDGSNWQVVSEKPSWITYTASFTGFSGSPTQSMKYSLNGKQMTINYYIDSSAASGTALTFSLPTGYTIAGPTYAYARVQSNSSFLSTGMAESPTGGTSINLYTSGATGAFSGSGNKAAMGQITFEIQ